MSKVYVAKIEPNAVMDLTNINPTKRESLLKKSRSEKVVSYFSWVLLRKVVKEVYNIDIDKLTLKYNEKGKPYLQSVMFKYNISHCDNVIALAISDQEVGIDIERINASRNYELLNKKIKAKSSSQEDVISKFSMVEAHMKKEGSGLVYSKIGDDVKITRQDKIEIDGNQYYLSMDFADNFVEFIIRVNL